MLYGPHGGQDVTGHRIMPRMDDQILQRIRRVLAKRGPDSPPGPVRLDRIEDAVLHAHVMELIERGEVRGDVVERDGQPVARVFGGLTEAGRQAMVDQVEAQRARQEQHDRMVAAETAARARRLKRIAVTMAATLAAVGLWFFLSPGP